MALYSITFEYRDSAGNPIKLQVLRGRIGSEPEFTKSDAESHANVLKKEIREGYAGLAKCAKRSVLKPKIRRVQ